MTILETTLLALALGVDSFVSATSLSLCNDKLDGQSRKLFIRFNGIFHIFMPLIGWGIVGLLPSIDSGLGDKISAAIFIVIGCKMLIDSYMSSRRKSQTHENECNKLAIPTILAMCFALSIDSLAVGFSLGFTNTYFGDIPFAYSIIAVSFIFGAAAYFMTAVGLMIGAGLKKRIGIFAPYAGATLLFLLAIKILLS